MENLVSTFDSTMFLAALAVGAAFVWWLLDRVRSNRPPGPRGVPLIGNIHLFRHSKSMQTYIQQLHQQYGDIVSYRLGVQTMVWIKDGALAKRLFSGEKFKERPVEQLGFAREFLDGDSSGGLVLNNGPEQFELRKFAFAALRDFGVGKKSLDEVIQSECTAFSQVLEDAAQSSNGVVSQLKIKTQSCAANIIHHIIFGFRYDFDDPVWIDLRTQLLRLFEHNFLVNVVNFFPFLKYIPGFNSKMLNDMASITRGLTRYVEDQIEEHRSTYCEGEIRDFTDLYIKNEQESKAHYNVRNIFLAILDIFRAGTDTTATTLAWAIQYLVKYPEIQKQLHEEVDQVIGDQTFNRKDKDKLIKVRAFLYEVLRYVTVAGQSAPHTVREPTSVNGFTIPANSMVFLSLYSLHHDKGYWGDPENFRINRWIGDNGEILLHEDHFLPFSSGKRVCIGRQLVLIEVILFMVEILQKFRFEKSDVGDKMKDEPATGLIRSPHSFHLKVIQRN